MIDRQEFFPHTFIAADGFQLPYQLRVPKGSGPFPLFLCMHGAGERGVDNQCTFVHFNPLYDREASPVDEAIIVIPQCPEDMRWVEYGWDKGSYQSADAPLSPAFVAVEELLETLFATLPVDKHRIYVTGISMGGFATWRMLAQHPDVFAAGIPICGGGPLDKADVLAGIPIRTFHCADDDIVPPKASRDMVAAIEAITPHHTEYTEYPQGGHGAWAPVYADPEQMEWLFDQRK